MTGSERPVVKCPFCESSFSPRGISSHVRAAHAGEYAAWKEARDKERESERERRREASRRRAEERARLLTGWEAGFLESVLSRLEGGEGLSPRQEGVLGRIMERREVPGDLAGRLERARGAVVRLEREVMERNRDENLDEHVAVMPRWGVGSVDGTSREAFAPHVGPVLIPDGWVYTSLGNPARTRAIKRHDRWWVVLEKTRLRRRDTWKPVGLLCPESVQDDVAAYLARTEARRQKARAYRARRRERELRERGITYEEAVLQFLDFADEYRDLALSFLDSLLTYSTVVDQFPVLPDTPRGRRLLYEVEVEVINHARHEHTDYEDRLLELDDLARGSWLSGSEWYEIRQEEYWEIKERANREAWEWIARHGA
ncbi:MAG: hypothetical protein ACTSU5_15680 [Promethearchaeota archaeon]